MHRSRQSGFTLIELMITVAIVGILASIAYPQYTKYVLRSQRTAAKAQMFDIANRQQQYLLANRAYASCTPSGSVPSQICCPALGNFTLPSELQTRYTCAVETSPSGITPPSFTITFTATGGQTTDGGLTLNSAGTKGCTPAISNCTTGHDSKWGS